MGKMFTFNGKPMVTWNPQTGCEYQCLYCWARPLAERMAARVSKYAEGFRPAFHYGDLRRKFKPGEFCFLTDMGDISFIEDVDLARVMEVITRNPQTEFLFCTKGPSWYGRHFPYPENVYLGTTIETNRDHAFSRALMPSHRYIDMRELNWPKKFVSIEPIMDFDLPALVQWISNIAPRIVEIGGDNHGHHLPEPTWFKVEALLRSLRDIVPVVVEKEGLDRLKK